MRLPRFSIADLMALTILIALDCLAVRAAWHSNDNRVILIFFGALPLLNILVVGLPILGKKSRRREAVSFLVGFQVAGWLLFSMDLVAILAFSEGSIVLFGRLTKPLESLTEAMFPVGLAIAIAVVMAMMTIPQLVVAYVAGALNRRYRIRIERRVPATSAT